MIFPKGDAKFENRKKKKKKKKKIFKKIIKKKKSKIAFSNAFLS